MVVAAVASSDARRALRHATVNVSVRSHSSTIEEAHERGRLLTLEGRSQNIKCPLLVVFGAGDRLISPAEGERLAKTTSGPAELVVYPEGNHVCFNISYKFRPLTADWMAKTLRA